MSLAPGTRFGPYEIVGPLGAGGMGEVYRAHDSRLGRDVAIKVLPPHLSSSPEIRARFEREARTISSLNHPHICTLYDVGRAPGEAGSGEADYLVMELVEGETLAQRLTRGPLPSSELLRTGIEIADALDRAHRAGIVHRDLKPANVMLTRSGSKLMDFGLARATGMAGPAGGSGATLGALSQSPTIAQALTAEGTIVGTFQYMSPEQLEGREADARADLWALGCLLYEMATGRRAFDGRSQASLIGAIMSTEPPPISASSADAAPTGAAPALDRLVRACLAKDPDQRIQTAHDVKLQLQWIAEGGSQAGAPAPVAIKRRGGEVIPWAVAGVAALVALALGAATLLRKPAPAEVLRFEIRLPRSVAAVTWPSVSPDGRKLAFLASDSTGTRRIWVRSLDALDAHPLTGGDVSARPFWSPDSRFLAFIVDGKLRKVPADGGPPVTICDAPGGSDGAWGREGVILFDGAGGDSIRQVPASGGTPKPATTMDHAHGETNDGWPFFLPDGRHFLYVAFTAADPLGIVHFGTLGSMKTVVIGHTDGRAQYAPPGYVVFTNSGTLLGQRIDPGSGRPMGDPTPIVDAISMGGGSGDFSVSQSGMLAYRGEAAIDQSRLVWMDRDGRVLGEAAPPGVYHDVALSPDGTRVALGINEGRSSREDIWVRDLVRGVSSRLTFDSTDEIWPVWSPDGTRIAYSSNRSGTFRCYIQSANGVGGIDSLPPAGGQDGPTDWSRDGATIACSSYGASGWGLYLMPASGKQPPTRFMSTPFQQRYGRFSPDGRWMAYSSNESGRYEVYVVPVVGGGGKWQVSTAGGSDPYWRADGAELYFRATDRTITAVPVTSSATLQLGNPIRLFTADVNDGGYNGMRWAPAADGKRFLVNVPVSTGGSAHLVVVSNWTTEVSRR